MKAEDVLSVEEREVAAVGTLFVRSVTAGEQLVLEDQIRSAGDDRMKLLAAQLSAYLCDDGGIQILSPEQATEFVQKRKAGTVKAVLQAALKLNGIGDKEELKGN